MSEQLYIVRLYDHFGPGHWVDVSGPISERAARKRLHKLTEGGSKMASDKDGDYYSVFPANTRMLFRADRLGG